MPRYQRGMKLFRVLILSACVALGAAKAHTQSTNLPGQGGFFAFGTIATTGQLGGTIGYAVPFASSGYFASPSNYTLDWSISGTAPSVCTMQGEGSSDNVHWYSVTGSLSCTTASMVHITTKPVAYFRLNVLTYTAGDGTTAVSVRYVRGGQ